MNAPELTARQQRGIDYARALAAFVREKCVGKQYDTCVNSPCRYSSGDGCQHPAHPKHASKQ